MSESVLSSPFLSELPRTPCVHYSRLVLGFFFLQFLSLKVLVKLNLLGIFCRHIKNFTAFSKSATAIKEHAAQKDLTVLSNSHLYGI